MLPYKICNEKQQCLPYPLPHLNTGPVPLARGNNFGISPAFDVYFHNPEYYVPL